MYKRTASKRGSRDERHEPTLSLVLLGLLLLRQLPRIVCSRGKHPAAPALARQHVGVESGELRAVANADVARALLVQRGVERSLGGGVNCARARGGRGRRWGSAMCALAGTCGHIVWVAGGGGLSPAVVAT